jgi:hypothetical protein
MNEREWLACENPQTMLRHLENRASERKLRLFACACGRRVLRLMPPEVGVKSLTLAERLAEGLAGEAERAAAEEEALRAARSYEQAPHFMGNAVTVAYFVLIRPAHWAAYHACSTASWTVGYAAAGGARHAAGGYFCDPAAEAAERHAQADLLREVVGKPLLRQRLRLNPSWLGWHDGAIPKLAQAIYDDRAFDRLPILADALEEAGCTDTEVLAHCRGGGEHVRGCLVVDRILGKG